MIAPCSVDRWARAFGGFGSGARANRGVRVGFTAAEATNIYYENTAGGAGNSVACRYAATASLLFCGAYSQASGSPSYHYFGCSTPVDCITHLLSGGDPPIFVNDQSDFHLYVPPSWFTDTPVDHGHDVYTYPYDCVPSVDLEGLTRPVQIQSVQDGDGGCTDMGAYEAQE